MNVTTGKLYLFYPNDALHNYKIQEVLTYIKPILTLFLWWLKCYHGQISNETFQDSREDDMHSEDALFHMVITEEHPAG